MQPITDPGVPFVGPVRLNQGEIVRIQGFVPPTADRFNINLHCGGPPSDIALHMSIRLLQNYIARNSLQLGAWGDEEDSGSLPIAVGQGFEVLILCDRRNYKIAINGNHFCEFEHRIPFQQVSHLAIDGDVALKLISFENGPTEPSAPPPVDNYAPPPSQYGPPPSQYGQQPPQYGQDRPYGGGPNRPPGYKEEEEPSGFDNFLETAGTVLVGALASGVASNLISNFTGSGDQSQHPQQQQRHQPPPPPPQPQQPLFGGLGGLGGMGGLGGDSSAGGLGSVGTALLSSLAGELLKPHSSPNKDYVPKPTAFSLQNQPPPYMPMPTMVPLPPANMPMPASGSPYGMPMPSNVPLPPTSMPMPPSFPQYPHSGMPMPPSGPFPTSHMPPSGTYPVQTYGGSPYVTPAYPLPGDPHYNKKQDKKMKKRLKKAAKYGIPIAAAGVGAYAISRAVRHSSSSSSSSD